MKALKLLIGIMLMATVIGGFINYAAGETRTLTTTLIITVKPADNRQAPAGLEEMYKTALAQSEQNRFIKVEDPVNTPTGLPRYTMSEKL